MDLGRFAQLRPFLFHVSARENLAGIQREHVLLPAAELMHRAGRSDLLRWRRRQPITMQINEHPVTLSDQFPLERDSISLERGWEFEDFIEYLNGHVFFWPGSADGPAKTGIRMPAGLPDEAIVMLRIGTTELFALNASEPVFCSVNVRAVRSEDARRSRRGPHLFSTAGEFNRRETEVIEVGFRSSVVLPASSMIRDAGSWKLLND